MKTVQLKFKTLLILLLIGFTFTSCSKDEDNNELSGVNHTYDITLLNKSNNVSRQLTGSVPNTAQTSIYSEEGIGGKPTIVMQIEDRDTTNNEITGFYGYFTLNENQQPLPLAIDSEDGFENGVGSALNLSTSKIIGLPISYPALSGTVTLSDLQIQDSSASYTLELDCVFRQEAPEIIYHASGKIIINPL